MYLKVGKSIVHNIFFKKMFLFFAKTGTPIAESDMPGSFGFGADVVSAHLSVDGLKKWAQAHDFNTIKAETNAALEFLTSKGVEKVGCIGFCYGDLKKLF